MKFLKITLLSLAITSFSYAQTQTYVGGSFNVGILKLYGNNHTDGYMETTLMTGFDVVGGVIIPLNNTFSWRSEGAYVFGFTPEDEINYGSFMLRTGFEIKSDSMKLIPYIMIGAGAIAVDPTLAFVSISPGIEALFGVRVPMKNNWNLNFGIVYSHAIMHYEEKELATPMDRMQGFVGVIKTF